MREIVHFDPIPRGYIKPQSEGVETRIECLTEPEQLGVAKAAILVVGLFDTVIDTPRFLFLLMLIVGIGAINSPRIRTP